MASRYQLSAVSKKPVPWRFHYKANPPQQKTPQILWHGRPRPRVRFVSKKQIYAGSYRRFHDKRSGGFCIAHL